jgi:hypothetical protein
MKNSNGIGNFKKNWKMNILNLKILKFRKIIVKSATIQRRLSEVSHYYYYYYNMYT